MPRCAGNKADGSPCERIVSASQRYCYAHDPATAEQRSRNASKAARSKPSREVHELKAELRKLKSDVLSGKVARGDAAVVVQVVRTLRDFIELERNIKETDELEERLQALEAMMKQGGGSRWG